MIKQLEDSIIHIDDFFRHQKIPYVIIGGVSAIFHGVQRTTVDIDITISIEIESLRTVAEKIVSHFRPVKKNPINFFEQFFVIPVIDEKTEIGIDISAGVGIFDKRVIERTIYKTIVERKIPFCSIEDLIIYKIAASRPRDLDDVGLLIAHHKNDLDKEYLLDVAHGFIEVERSDIYEIIKKMLL